MRNAAEDPKRLPMTLEEGFLLLSWEGHDEGPALKAESHMDELDDALGAYHGAIRLAPVDLCVASEIELKRQEDVWTALIRAAFADVAAYHRLTAFVAFFAEISKIRVCCVALLTRQALALGEQFIDPSLERISIGDGRGAAIVYVAGPANVIALQNRVARATKRLGDVPNALAFDVVGAPNRLAVFQ